MPKGLTSQTNIKKVLLLIVIVIGLFVRVIDLENTPSGLHADEASFLLNAQSILETGRDEDNRLLPISLNSLIDPKPALYSYLQIPFIALMGPSIAAARLPAAIMGTVSLVLIYFLMKEFGKEELGLLMCFLLAISPWHIVVSRATQEVILSFLFLMLAFYFANKFFQTDKKKWLLTFATAGFFSMYAYHSAKIFLPVFILAWGTYLFIKDKIKLNKILLVVAAVVFSVLISVSLQESTSRFSAIGLLNDPAPPARVLEQIYGATGIVPSFVLRSFYNKPTEYFREFVSEYLSHFDPDFLFISGGEPKRYLVPFHGLFYLVEIPLFLLGLYASALQKKKSLFIFFILILFLAPLPAALTSQETPSMIRVFPMMTAMIYFIAEGILFLAKLKVNWKTPVLVLLSLFYCWQISYFAMQFFVQQKVHQPWYRNNPYSEIAHKLTFLESDFNKILVTNDLRPLYAYFALEGLIDISALQKQPLARNEAVYQIYKYEFNQKSCYLGELEPGVLYIAESVCREQSKELNKLKVVESITYPDGNLVYELLTLPQEYDQKVL